MKTGRQPLWDKSSCLTEGNRINIIMGNKAHPFGKVFRYGFTVLLSLCFMFISNLPCSADSSTPQPPLQVLVVYSYHKDMPWNITFNKGLTDGLTDAKKDVITYEEYIDSGRFSESVHQEAFYNFLKAKYSRVRIDLIIASNSHAHIFFHKYPLLFPGVKKIIFQTDYKNSPTLEGLDNIDCNIQIFSDFKKSISEMIRLTSPEKLFVIADTKETSGRKRLMSFKDELKNFQGIKTEFLIDHPMDKLLQDISRLPDRSVIYYLLVFQDGKGHHMIPFQAAKMISKRANAPMFSHWESLMGSGIVGGYQISGERVGNTAARLIMDHIQEKPYTFRHEDAFDSYYDWQQLQRWKIDTKKLPDNAVILNRPPSFWNLYKWYILSIAFISLAMTVISLLNYRTIMMKRLNTELSSQATTDTLTGVLNRRGIEPHFEREMNRKRRFRHPVSLMIIDLDHFKQINDRYGHAAGDEVLTEVASAIKSNIRNTDNVARWGGDEFIVLAENTNIVQAVRLSEKIHNAIMSINFKKIETITVSIGVSEYHSDENFQLWYDHADKALYRAKNEGRNRVIADQSVLSKKELSGGDILQLAWNDELYSGHVGIDEQRIAMFDQANNFMDALLNDTDRHTIDAMLERLVSALKEHFVYEEQVLKQVRYPELENHISAHRDLVSKLDKLVDDSMVDAVDFFTFLKFVSNNIILGHFATADENYFHLLKSD